MSQSASLCFSVMKSKPVWPSPEDKLEQKKDKKRRKDIDRTLKLAEQRSCVKVEVAVLVSLSLIVLMVSVDVKQCIVQELC